jgi:hypothetical protein
MSIDNIHYRYLMMLEDPVRSLKLHMKSYGYQ